MPFAPNTGYAFAVWNDTWHLRSFRFAPVRQFFVKNRADMRMGMVGRQVKLNRDSFPKTVGVLENPVAGNVARENRHRVHPDAGEILSKASLPTWREVLD